MVTEGTRAPGDANENNDVPGANENTAAPSVATESTARPDAAVEIDALSGEAESSGARTSLERGSALNADAPRTVRRDVAGWAMTKTRPGPRKHIAHEIRRQLLMRDGVCCAFVSPDGRRCEARAFLQFHHRHAWARGGPDTVDNLALLCQARDRLLAEQDFGQAHVAEVIAQRTAIRPSSPASSESGGRSADERER